MTFVTEAERFFQSLRFNIHTPKDLQTEESTDVLNLYVYLLSHIFSAFVFVVFKKQIVICLIIIFFKSEIVSNLIAFNSFAIEYLYFKLLKI